MFLCYYHLGLRQHCFPELFKYFLSGTLALLSLLYKLIPRMILSKFKTDHIIPLLLKIHFFFYFTQNESQNFYKGLQGLKFNGPPIIYIT